jgi:polyribonucleotide nucleotidyltransferase
VLPLQETIYVRYHEERDAVGRGDAHTGNGRVARQADGSVIATLGETTVMANVTFAKEPKPGQDFFPLTVHYQEKYYAAGKVPGGFFKREARPTEKETLTARLIDRPIRPLFVPGFKNEVLVMCTVLSATTSSTIPTSWR